MLGYNEFHHDLLAKYTKLFGSLFTGLEVYRENTTEVNRPSKQKVPLAYGPLNKITAFSQEEHESDKAAVATITPRMGFQRTSVMYDPSRRTNKFQSVVSVNGPMRNFVPYNLTFELYVVGKTGRDCERVVEQIIPFFDPTLTMTIYPVKGDTSISRDVPITLNQVMESNNYEGYPEDRQEVVWTLGFTMQAFMFIPVAQAGSVIKKVIVNYHDLDAININESSEVYPGLTADGEPTTDPEEAVDYITVEADDPFAVITEFKNG